MIWEKHTEECIKTKTHMICHAEVEGKLEFRTYDMKRVGSDKKSPVPNGGLYDNLEKAKAVCHKSAGKVSTKGMSLKKKAQVNFGNMRDIIKRS